MTFILKYGDPSRQGYLGLETFISLVNFLKPIMANNYDKIVNKLVKTTKTVVDYYVGCT